MLEDLYGLYLIFNRKGLFGKWRFRYSIKSLSRILLKMSFIVIIRKYLIFIYE